MPLSDITTRQPILEAMREADRLGQDRFLRRYGFRRSRSYRLLHEGKHYDSKAIVGAAHGFAKPDLGPLKPADFSGGEATVQRKLEELGFTVERGDTGNGTTEGEDAGPNHRDFLLTWKETGWPHENILRMLRSFHRDGFVDETWRFRSHRQCSRGDRVWLLRQGAGEKGIFGVGSIVGEPAMGNAGNGKRQMMVPVRFSRFTDPNERLLIGEDDVRSVLSAQQIRQQASGYPITEEQAEALSELIGLVQPQIPALPADAADVEPFDPSNIADARQRALRAIAQRRGQKAFRDALVAAYGGKCVVSGCNVLDVLEAAHIYPYRGPDTNKVSNGLLLRADIHTLFDCNLITVDPHEMHVIVAPILRGTEYGAFHGKRIAVPLDAKGSPSKQALSMHFSAAGMSL